MSSQTAAPRPITAVVFEQASRLIDPLVCAYDTQYGPKLLMAATASAAAIIGYGETGSALRAFTSAASALAGSVAGAAAGGFGGYQLWNNFTSEEEETPEYPTLVGAGYGACLGAMAGCVASLAL